MSALMVNSITSNASSPRNSVSNATITSQRAMNPREKCTCKVAEVPISNSSTSIVSEHCPVKRKMLQKEMPKAKYIPPPNRTIVTCRTPRPARLQPPTNVPCREQYFSCSSEDSESEETVALNKSQCPCPDTKLNKTQAILDFLQEIITLLNTNVTKREELLQTPPAASSAIQEKYSGIPPTVPESEMNLPPPPPPPPPPPEPEPECIAQAQAQATVPNWCPCVCFARGMAMATGQPPIMLCMQPFNMQAATLYQQSVPKPCVFEGTEDSFKDCFSSSVARDGPPCAGKYDYEREQHVAGMAMATGQPPIMPCMQPFNMQAATLYQQSVPKPCVFGGTGDSFKDYFSSSVARDEPPCAGKSDYEREQHVAGIDEEIMPIIGERPSFDHHKCYGPGLDSLEQYEDEEPTPP